MLSLEIMQQFEYTLIYLYALWEVIGSPAFDGKWWYAAGIFLCILGNMAVYYFLIRIVFKSPERYL